MLLARCGFRSPRHPRPTSDAVVTRATATPVVSAPTLLPACCVSCAAGGLSCAGRAGQGSPGVRGQLQAPGHLNGVAGSGAHVLGRPEADEGHGRPHHEDCSRFQVRSEGGGGAGRGD